MKIAQPLRVGTAVLAALSLSGCMIAGRDYSRPDLGLPAGHAVPISEEDAITAANTPWFALYRDPELQSLIRESLAHNLDLQLAFARIEEVEGRLRTSRSRLFPWIDGALQTSPAAQTNSNDSSFTLGLILNWEIDLFGKLRRENEAVRAQLLATRAGRDAVVSTLVQQVAASWLSIRELQAEERILERNIALQQRSLGLVQSLHRAGVVSDSEEQQARGQLAGTRAQLPQIRKTRLISENLLATLLGRYPSPLELAPVADQGGERGIASHDLPLGVPADLLARRPDVRMAEQALVAATAREGVAIANRFPFPTIGLSALFGRASGQIDGLFDDAKSVSINSWGPNVTLPILAFGRDQGGVDTARAQTKQALIQYRQAVQNSMLDVYQAVYTYRAAQDQLAPLADQLAAAERSLHLQDLRFKSGVNDYLSVLDAQRQLLSTEVALERARLNRDLAFVDLYRALGGGWDSEEIEQD
ncbi:MAG: efflux transporter outer membrane subunit [Sphingopyxis sp.]|uniref:efflux transporter outer membrane subunit n=1 Tax=Sphingopyxis sp. TaxID=1908224 RepID=UPI002ABA5DFF|nr:efflux transporter outer membrane subunit [Sphingopyxis sp.]MDZ3832825.1 efflux transporter outer membrane subunit [Sphingopyxis sp.]